MSNQLPFIPAFVRNLNAKMAEAQRGGYCLNAEEKCAIANEIGVISKATYMAMWEAIDR